MTDDLSTAQGTVLFDSRISSPITEPSSNPTRLRHTTPNAGSIFQSVDKADGASLSQFAPPRIHSNTARLVSTMAEIIVLIPPRLLNHLEVLSPMMLSPTISHSTIKQEISINTVPGCAPSTRELARKTMLPTR